MQNIFTDYGKTEGFDDFKDRGRSPFGSEGWEPTDAAVPFGRDSGPTDFAGWAEANGTANEGTVGYGEADISKKSGFAFEESSPTEVITPEDIHGFMPVVGWLVCIEGKDRGRDYKLHVGYNSIGRDTGNDVCVTGDTSISRQSHALVGYDEESNMFFFGREKGVNIVRLNGEPLMESKRIKAKDVLTIGKSKFMFIPFCSEDFKWGTGSD